MLVFFPVSESAFFANVSPARESRGPFFYRGGRLRSRGGRPSPAPDHVGCAKGVGLSASPPPGAGDGRPPRGSKHASHL